MVRRNRAEVLEEILAQVEITRDPRVLRALHRRLNIEEAEEFCYRLRPGMDLQPYDFPSTKGVWQSLNEDEIPYLLVATKEFIVNLAETQGVDYTTFEGFKSLLPCLSESTFYTYPINEWGTNLCGMLAKCYNSSPSAAVLDLVRNDDDFKEIRLHNLQAYDFPYAPMGTWVDEKGNPTDTARAATRQLIIALAAADGADYTTFEGFKSLMPLFVQHAFHTSPINEWGTTLVGMISKAYQNSPSAAVLDLVYCDDEFEEIRRHNLRAYDFPRAPMGTWIDADNNPTDTARAATKQLIIKLSENKDVNIHNIAGFSRILQSIKQSDFLGVVINEWGATFNGMFACAYGNSPSAAIKDLAAHDEFIRRALEYAV